MHRSHSKRDVVALDMTIACENRVERCRSKFSEQNSPPLLRKIGFTESGIDCSMPGIDVHACFSTIFQFAAVLRLNKIVIKS